jgi:HAD superfamily hydrolase (TIGR01459 family)
MKLEGLSTIARDFDGMLIDQFGVIHNGKQLYPGALEALERLRDLHIPVAILTNSGKRAKGNEERLMRLGVPKSCFVGVVSSGEVCFQSLDVKRAFFVGRDGEDYGFDGIEAVANPQDAEMMLILGSNSPKTPMEDYRNLFEGLSLPAICCNPDRLMITSSGLQPAPGAIAAVYEAMGGKVTWIGKPFSEIYRHAAALIGNPSRILCIGDSAEHDIVGGRTAGFKTLLTLTGVSEGHDPNAVTPRPDYWMDAFQW